MEFGKPAEIGNGYSTATVQRARVLVDWKMYEIAAMGRRIGHMENIRRLMMGLHVLDGRIHRAIHTPIECDASCRRIADQIGGGIPREGLSDAGEFPFLL